MISNTKIFQAPDGKKIPFYAEIGKFFNPDGSFDEIFFRNNLNEYLDKLKETLGKKGKYRERINKWFSSYLSEILDYLGEKNMSEASYLLFNAAIEEFSRIGIEMVNISSRHLKNILSKIPSILSNGKKKISVNAKRSIIFKAAVQVFSADGFHKATMDKIASLSGVGKGSLYRYFNSKEDLLSELLTEKYEEIIKQFNIIFSKETDIINQITKMIEFWVSFIDENHDVYRLIQSEAISQKTGDRVMFYDYIITNLPMFKERILAFNLENKIKTTSFYSVIYGILGFIDGVVYKWTRKGMNYSLKEEIPIILEVLFNGFIGENLTKKKYYAAPILEKLK